MCTKFTEIVDSYCVLSLQPKCNIDYLRFSSNWWYVHLTYISTRDIFRYFRVKFISFCYLKTTARDASCSMHVYTYDHRILFATDVCPINYFFSCFTYDLYVTPVQVFVLFWHPWNSRISTISSVSHGCAQYSMFCRSNKLPRKER